LRHTFAVEYLRGGADTFTLERILGNSTLEMTRHYAGVSDGDVEIKQKAFSPAERLGIRVSEAAIKVRSTQPWTKARWQTSKHGGCHEEQRVL
jgi:hypothetical protein